MHNRIHKRERTEKKYLKKQWVKICQISWKLEIYRSKKTDQTSSIWDKKTTPRYIKIKLFKRSDREKTLKKKLETEDIIERKKKKKCLSEAVKSEESEETPLKYRKKINANLGFFTRQKHLSDIQKLKELITRRPKEILKESFR